MPPKMPGYGLGSKEQTNDLLGNSGDLMERIGSTVDATRNVINARALGEVTKALGIGESKSGSPDVTAELLGAVTGAMKGTVDLQSMLMERALKGGNGNSDQSLIPLLLLLMMKEKEGGKGGDQAEQFKVVLDSMSRMYETVLKVKDEYHERERSRLERSSGMGPTEAHLQTEVYPALIQAAMGKMFQTPTEHLKELAENAQQLSGLLKTFGGNSGGDRRDRIEDRKMDLEELRIRKEAEREAKKPSSLDTMAGVANLIGQGSAGLGQLINQFIGSRGFAPVDYATQEDQAAADAAYAAAQGGPVQ